ncbi:hypothetical protein L210DRAFT_2066549 [Boletus edulis BED1]|uniref:Uncharacterized protein n=1 Tax=Boletus edulis BED1 TaxID=1328754 RepID=A0AAD4GGF9_BOLED|nr:hypothetical protein L210DRAFT_2066549 [Boletus edulis BED1]
MRPGWNLLSRNTVMSHNMPLMPHLPYHAYYPTYFGADPSTFFQVRPRPFQVQELAVGQATSQDFSKLAAHPDLTLDYYVE